MKIKEHDSMMAYLQRKPNILSNNINSKKISHTERQRFAKGTNSDTKVMPKKDKMLQYINDVQIVYGDKKATKAETEAATKRVEARSEEAKKMSYQDEYNFLYNKKSPKYYKNQIAKKIPVIPPKPDLPNGHSDWSTEEWLESIDPGGWVNDKKVQVEENLIEKYLELLKAGELLPGTTFEMFEKNFQDFDTEVISKINKEINKRIAAKKRAEGLAALMAISPDRI